MLATVFLKVLVALCNLFVCTQGDYSLWPYLHQLTGLLELMTAGVHEVFEEKSE